MVSANSRTNGQENQQQKPSSRLARFMSSSWWTNRGAEVKNQGRVIHTSPVPVDFRDLVAAKKVFCVAADGQERELKNMWDVEFIHSNSRHIRLWYGKNKDEWLRSVPPWIRGGIYMGTKPDSHFFQIKCQIADLTWAVRAGDSLSVPHWGDSGKISITRTQNGSFSLYGDLAPFDDKQFSHFLDTLIKEKILTEKTVPVPKFWVHLKKGSNGK
jgi:hypothetical protein